MIELTNEQRNALTEPEPVVVDPCTREEYVLVRRALYERLRQAYEAVDPSLYEFEEIES